MYKTKHWKKVNVWNNNRCHWKTSKQSKIARHCPFKAILIFICLLSKRFTKLAAEISILISDFYVGKAKCWLLYDRKIEHFKLKHLQQIVTSQQLLNKSCLLYQSQNIMGSFQNLSSQSIRLSLQNKSLVDPRLKACCKQIHWQWET